MGITLYPKCWRNRDDNRPHLVVEGVKRTHVAPVALFEGLVSGKLKMADIDDLEDMLPTIVSEWLGDYSK